ncbi:MAG: hypothetical protein JWN14_1954 [Chthonomonadales bacterium]|nr:hypothetical protein [Chthonomonadales bacterium]
MKTKLSGVLLTIGAALGLMAFRGHAAPPDLSSPKATVRSFIAAMKNRDLAMVGQCIQGAGNADLLKQMFGGESALPIESVVALVEEKEGDTTRVAAEYTLRLSSKPQDAKNGPLTLVDMFTLVKQGETWLLVKDPALTASANDTENSSVMLLGQTRPLSFAVALSASPEIAQAFKRAQSTAQAVSCVSNVKQIALGVMVYVQDYDEVTPRKNASYVDQIDAYIKNREIFTCPLDPAGTISYTFNSGVAGIPLSAIASPAKTVMLYEGKAGKLDYRHDGKAVVGFMDGHVKQIGSDEAAGLIWTVKAPKPVAKPAKKKTKR